MFGAGVNKAIESFQKSLDLDPQKDETWVWLAQAFKQKSDAAKAREGLDKALQLSSESPFARKVGASLRNKHSLSSIAIPNAASRFFLLSRSGAAVGFGSEESLGLGTFLPFFRWRHGRLLAATDLKLTLRPVDHD